MNVALDMNYSSTWFSGNSAECVFLLILNLSLSLATLYGINCFPFYELRKLSFAARTALCPHGVCDVTGDA